MDELEECVPSNQNIENEVEYDELKNNINSFLYSLSEKNRNIFLDRYWYMYSIKEISKKYNANESNIKVNLYRTRNILKSYLEERGVSI